MNVKVTLFDKPTAPLCIYIDSQLIRCFAANEHVLNITINLEKTAELTLQDNAGTSIASHTLEFSHLAVADFNSRTRLPWSVF